MVAIVMTLGGYLAGLHWLVSPPDPWQSNPKTAQIAQQTIKKRLPPVVAPAEPNATAEVTTASREPDTKLASVETSTSVQTREPETVRPIQQNAVEATTQPVAAPAHIVRREMPPTKTKPVNRKRVERDTNWN
jgi:septal ring-binding cell division protein DamX